MNNYNIINKIVLLIAFGLISIESNAQTDDKNNLNAGQVNVVQDYKPTLGDAVRINTNPMINDSAPAIPKLNYSVIDQSITTDFKVEPITPAKMKGEPLQKLYNSYANLGFGNYNNALVDFYYANLRSKKVNFGFEGNHFSSSGKIKNYGNEGFADNHIGGFANFFIPEHVLKVKAGFTNQSIHYYGYDRDYYSSLILPQIDNSAFQKQYYNTFDISTGLYQNTKNKDAIYHEFEMSYYNFSDKLKNMENSFSILAAMGKKVDKETYGGRVLVDYYNNKMTHDTSQAAIITLNPFVTSSGDKWSVRLGINVAIETDAGKTHFLPDLNAKYNFVKDILSGYAEFKGNSYRNSYRSLATTNPFIDVETVSPNSVFPDPFHFRTSTCKLDGALGLRGNITSKLFFDVNGRYKIIDSMALFVNRPEMIDFLQNNFTVIYDNVQMAQFNGLLGYRLNNKLTVAAKVTYNKYIMDVQEKPWQLPALEASLNGKYNLGDKITVGVDIFYIGKRDALVQTYTTTGTTPILYQTQRTDRKLKGFTDANLAVEYHYSKRLSMFIHINNIAATQYYRWNNYPSQRLNVLVGGNFTF